jgi:hypothetical protein
MFVYLDPNTINRSCADAELDDAHRIVLQRTAAAIAASEPLCKLIDLVHQRTYHGLSIDPARAEALKIDLVATYPGSPGELAGVIALDSVRLARERQTVRDIPAESTRQLHLRHAQYLLNEHRRKHGASGSVRPSYLFWFGIVASGELCRVGLLEYAITPNRYAVHAYAHRQTGAVIALSAPGQKYDDEGFQVGPLTWEAALQESEQTITGHPISPLGYALRQPLALPSADWACVLAPGDCVLDMHIPEGNTLHLEDIRTSLLQTEMFFARHFPECPPFKAFVCESWLFSTLLEAFLPAESRIVAWQREHYLCPIGDQGDGEHSFKAFVFGDSAIDLATAPRTTRLQRAVSDHAMAGRPFRTGSAFLLRQDLARFGTQPYRAASQQAIAVAYNQP